MRGSTSESAFSRALVQKTQLCCFPERGNLSWGYLQPCFPIPFIVKVRSTGLDNTGVLELVSDTEGVLISQETMTVEI